MSPQIYVLLIFFLIAFLPTRDFDLNIFILFSGSFFFYSLSVLSALVEIVRGKVLCLTACFFKRRQIAVKSEKEAEAFGATPSKGGRDNRQRD